MTTLFSAEAYDPRWAAVLALSEVAQQRFQIGMLLIGLDPGAAEPATKVVEN